MNDEYIKGFCDGLLANKHHPQTLQIMDYSFEQVCELIKKDQENKMTNKYQWCEPNAKNDKEFLGWLYERLRNVFGEHTSDTYMQRLSKIADDMPGAIPNKMTKMLENNPTLASEREVFRKELDKLGHPEATHYSHWALEAFDRVHGLRD